ncbi:MAG: hypothetical protein C6P37_03330 [Caldibacillus debilis]|uniref:Uncharacterized protein n=1 Tax=Caldibacillus debilis TaxID=301148 RepID=A0A150M2K3_9BACI|nr:hypothetical protein B4135_2264 [Caldibacillus debilis]MBO2482238.1 hypothetical protein [Bacillaceae bacterium]REJ30489.1 MAG: hypothetical protein C6P37_03330 [Caldibacillus debilis]REJ30709.1 MAG: hypothetical protein C6W56_01830 [Caldibacillus debilis]
MLAKGKKQRFEKLPTGKGKQARYGRKIFGRPPFPVAKIPNGKRKSPSGTKSSDSATLPAKNSNRKKGECPCQISGRRQPFGEEKRPFPRGNI